MLVQCCIEAGRFGCSPPAEDSRKGYVRDSLHHVAALPKLMHPERAIDENGDHATVPDRAWRRQPRSPRVGKLSVNVPEYLRSSAIRRRRLNSSRICTTASRLVFG